MNTTIIKALFPYVIVSVITLFGTHHYMSMKNEVSDLKWSLLQTEERLKTVEYNYTTIVEMNALKEKIRIEHQQWVKELNLKFNKHKERMEVLEDELNSTPEGRSSNSLNPDVVRVLKSFQDEH